MDSLLTPEMTALTHALGELVKADPRNDAIRHAIEDYERDEELNALIAEYNAQQTMLSDAVRSGEDLGEDFGKTVRDIIGEENADHMVITRMMRGKEVFFPDLNLPLQEGDKLLIVTDVQHKDKVRIIFGESYPVDMNEWRPTGTKLVARVLSVTKSSITGKSLR